MKPLKISKEQKDKLLEMCKALFPEYPNILFSDHQGRCHYHSSIDNQIFIYFAGSMGGLAEPLIHWFEFCMTYLPIKLMELKKIFSSELNTFLLGQTWSLMYFREFGDYCSVHPVDHLYNEFKKLKL